MELARQPAVVLGDLRAAATAARVTQERKVLAAGEPHRVVKHGELPELDKMIAASAGSELCPRTVFQSRRQVRDLPIGVHHVVLAARTEGGAHPETRLALQRARQTRPIVRERLDRQVQYRQL